MSILQDPAVEPAPAVLPSESKTQPTEKTQTNGLSVNGTTNSTANTAIPAAMASPIPKASLDTSVGTSNSTDPLGDFDGEVDTNNNLPTQATLRKVEDTMVLDQDGKAVPFKSLYTGPNVARRVLVIFVRHFFCGNCQEYIRSLAASITPSDLLALPVPTFIAVVGCGTPSLIKMYQETTSCPFPIYADPSKTLYQSLGMVRTLALGERPEYMKKSLLNAMFTSIVQELKSMKTGKALQGGDPKQVGGEFLFEPVVADLALTPVLPSPGAEEEMGRGRQGEKGGAGGYFEEEKRVTWCHRMRNTRDHAEIPEIREVLGLDGVGQPRSKSSKRWSKALGQRKGTGLSAMSGSSMSEKQSVLVGNGVDTEGAVGTVKGH